jgi:hypothetical protein
VELYTKSSPRSDVVRCENSAENGSPKNGRVDTLKEAGGPSGTHRLWTRCLPARLVPPARLRLGQPAPAGVMQSVSVC